MVEFETFILDLVKSKYSYLIKSIIQESNLEYITPLINITDDNVVVLEWWNFPDTALRGKQSYKKLTFYIDDIEIHYLKTDNKDTQDGNIDLNDKDKIIELWKWLGEN